MCQLRMLRTVGKILFFSCLVGMYIYFIYKLFTKSAFYSKDFNITIAGVAIIIAMQSSLVVALGMVGALSIVRFRTAIKNLLDLLYLFWAISAGIICGVSLYALAAALCIIMTVLIFVLNRLPNSKAPTLAIIRMDKECQIDNVTSILKIGQKFQLKDGAEGINVRVFLLVLSTVIFNRIKGNTLSLDNTKQLYSWYQNIHECQHQLDLGYNPQYIIETLLLSFRV